MAWLPKTPPVRAPHGGELIMSFRYYDLDDVRTWAAFLEPRLDDLVARYLSVADRTDAVRARLRSTLGLAASSTRGP